MNKSYGKQLQLTSESKQEFDAEKRILYQVNHTVLQVLKHAAKTFNFPP
jgi:hypothetical protein